MNLKCSAMDRSILALIVEDNDVDFQIADFIFRKISNRIFVNRCRNGEEAVSYLYDLKTSIPDFILLDIDMPIMNGKEFLKLKAKNESFRDIPVIILSSSTLSVEKEECLKLGAVDFIEKPLTVEAVDEILRVHAFINTSSN